MPGQYGTPTVASLGSLAGSYGGSSLINTGAGALLGSGNQKYVVIPRIIIDHVLQLSQTSKQGIMMFVKNTSKGIGNNLQRFSTPSMAEKEIVSVRRSNLNSIAKLLPLY